MRMFSIIQAALTVRFTNDPDADGGKALGIAFSEDPNDSSIVRMRLAPPDNDDAVEITFDRNGRERGRRFWPLKYPAWSDKSPEDLDKEDLEAETADEKEIGASEKPAGKTKGKAK